MRVISETEVVLKEVRQQADVMCQKNREAALKYVTEIRDSMKDRTIIGAKKVNQVIEENLSSIRVQLLALETTTKDIFNGLVDIFQSDINDTMNSLSAADEQNLTSALHKAISQAEYEVHSMWNDIDQMYTFYSSYTTDMIQNKGENITDRINGLVASQRRYCDCFLYERVSMCYNISLANIETSKTIEKLVHVINDLYNTTNTVDKLHYMHPDADEHALSVINDSTSLLDKYKKSSQEMLETLIADHYCFLGSAVRHTSEQTYPHIKRFILRSWRSAIEKASSYMNSTLTVDPLIKDEYRHRIIDDSKESLRKLGDLIKTKASLLQDEATKNSFIEKADFKELGYLMESRFKNVTEVINTAYKQDLWCASETTKYNVQFIVDQKVPFVSSLSIQNYLPTDVCPLAVDFSNFIRRLLNTDLFKDSGNDMLDRLLPEHGEAVTVNDVAQIDDNNTSSAEDTSIHISILLLGDEPTKDEQKTVAGETTSTQLVPSDDLDKNGGHPVVEPKPFLGGETTATSDYKSDKTKPNEPVLNYNVEPKPDGYKEEEPKEEAIKAENTIPDMNQNVIESKVSAESNESEGGKSSKEQTFEPQQPSQILLPPNIQPVPIEPIGESLPAMNGKLFDVEDELKLRPQETPSKEIQGSLVKPEKVDVSTQTEEPVKAMQQDTETAGSHERILDEAKKSEVSGAERLKPQVDDKNVRNNSHQNSAASSEQDDGSAHSFLSTETENMTDSQKSDKIKEKFRNVVKTVIHSLNGKVDRR